MYRREFGTNVDNGGAVSFDDGETWKTIPNLSNDSWIDTIVVGTKLVRAVTSQNGNTDAAGTQIWTLESSSENPIWELQHTFSQDGYLVTKGPNTSVAGAAQHLTYAVHTADGAQTQSFMSTDVGVTWVATQWPCGGGAWWDHSAGLVCMDGDRDNSPLFWYESANHEWTEYTVSFDDDAVVDDASLEGGVYFVRDGELWSWQRESGETFLMQVDTSFPFEVSRVLGIFSGYVYVEHFGLWRAPVQ